MKEPKKIRLTDNPESKKVNLTPLPSQGYYDIAMDQDVWVNNENHQQNNSQSVQQLEPDSPN